MESDISSVPEEAQTHIKDAVQSNDYDRVKRLISDGHVYTATQAWRNFLGQVLSVTRSKAVGELLIDNGANKKARARGGATALMEATDKETIKVLVFDLKVDLEETDDEGRTCLRRAVELDAEQWKAKCLIEHRKPNLDASDKDGRNVLMTAIWKGHKEIFDLLLERGADAKARDHRERTTLHHLASLKERNYEYQPNHTNLHQLLDRHMLKRLLSKDVDPHAKDDKGRTCLHEAAAWGCCGRLKVFLMFGNFLKDDVYIEPEDDGGWTPMHNACEADGDVVESVEILQSYDSDPKQKTRNGRTPLHLAAGAGNVKIVRHLLSLPEIDRNARDMFGNTPMLSTANITNRRVRRETVMQFAPWQKLHSHHEDMIETAQMWNATIVDFEPIQEKKTNVPIPRNESREGLTELLPDRTDVQTRSTEPKRLRHTSVFNLLYGRKPKSEGDDSKPDEPLQTVSPPALGEGGFRWIHIPSNNVIWAQDLFTKYYVEEGTMDINSFKALERSFNQQRGGDLPQSRYMSSTCQPVFRAWGNEEGGSTVGDSSEGGPSRSQTTDFAQGATSGGAEDQDSVGNQLVNLDDILGTERVDSIPSSNDDQETHLKPVSLTKSQPLKKDNAFISDFYVFMPYLHFETVNKQKDMSDYYNHFAGIEDLKDEKRPTDKKKLRGKSYAKDVALLRAHLDKADHSLHIRRTLDQSFYHHINTQVRDSDQVIHRFQKHISNHDDDKSKILMVDQLWMWVIGEKMVVTAFPPRWDQPKKDPLNLLEYVLSIIDLRNRDPIKSVYELAMIISGRCYGAYDRHGVGSEDPHFLDMFEGWISAAMDDEVKLFELFEQDSTKASELLRNPDSLREIMLREEEKRREEWPLLRKNQPSKPDEPKFRAIRDPPRTAYPSTEDSFVGNLLDITRETQLFKEVKDIKDEIGMIRLIFERQELVRQGIKEAITSISVQNKVKRWSDAALQKFNTAFKDHERTISQPSKDMERMLSQVDGVYQSVRDLLDFKQKQANALEARYARQQAVDTSRQERTLLRQGKQLTVFTTVTTVFLPISFIAAFFAIDIKELPHDDKGNQVLTLGYVSKRTFIPGVVVALVLVVLALYVEHVWYFVKHPVYSVQYGWDLLKARKQMRQQNQARKSGAVSNSIPLQRVPSRPRPPGLALSTTVSQARSADANAYSMRTMSRRPRSRFRDSGTLESQSTMVNGSI